MIEKILKNFCFLNFKLNNRFSNFRKEQSDWTERLDKKQNELDDLYKQFNDRKFALEKSRAMTLSSTSSEKDRKKRFK